MAEGDFEIIIEKTQTLTSDAHIIVTETITSDAYIFSAGEEVLTSDAYRLRRVENS
jgi:hypothetical protein